MEARIHFETRSGDQGYLTGTLIFADDSKLHFSEFLDQTGEIVDKLMYAYHYQDTGNQLIFRCDPSQFPNLTLKKIPNAVLTRCEWGKDDYSLAVANLPPKPMEPGTQPSLFEVAQP